MTLALHSTRAFVVVLLVDGFCRGLENGLKGFRFSVDSFRIAQPENLVQLTA